MWRYIKNSIYVILLSSFAIGLSTSPTVFAATKVQTSICGDFLKPTVLSPIKGLKTQDASVLLSGSAQPFLPVAVTTDSAVNGITTAAADGTYALQVSLHTGDNTVVASNANGCGVMKESESIIVHRDGTPQIQQHAPVAAANPQQVKVSVRSSLATVIPHALGQSFVTIPPGSSLAEPVIKQPTSGEIYASSRVWVVGNAVSDSVVTIYLNDVSVAKISASAKGEFAAVIELHAGGNTLQLRAEKDGATATSKKSAVTLTKANPVTPRPSIGSVLTVAAVTTATVAMGAGGLTWTVRRIRVRFK